MSKEMIDLADEIERLAALDAHAGVGALCARNAGAIVAALRASAVAEPVADAEFAYRFEYADGSAFEVMPDSRLFLTCPDGRREEKRGKITSRLTRFYGVRPTHPAPAAPVPASVREALEKIAKQATSAEMREAIAKECAEFESARSWHASAGLADFEGGYDECVSVARAALASLPAPEAAPTREEIAGEIRRVVGADLSHAQCTNLADAILALKAAPAK